MLIIAIMSVIALARCHCRGAVCLGPLHRIEARSSARDPNDLTPIEAGAPREITELVEAINRFMQRLAERMDEFRHMIDDAAHQIRTPVAAVDGPSRSLAERDAQPAKRRHHMERVVARTAQIGRLANQFLSQTLVSHRASSVTADRLDLRDVCARPCRCHPHHPGARHRCHSRLPCRENADGRWRDPVSLREAIRNIIDNAIQHGAAGRLDFRSVRGGEGHHCLPRSADDGPGIPEEHRPQVTKRFWRAAAEGDGFGLGLAIAADVARNHSASLDFATTADGDFAVRLMFPVVAAVMALHHCNAVGLHRCHGAGRDLSNFHPLIAITHAVEDRRSGDIAAIEPLIRDFQSLNPAVSITYVDTLTNDLFTRNQRGLRLQQHPSPIWCSRHPSITW